MTRQERVWWQIKAMGPCTTQDVADVLGCTRKEVACCILQMVEQGCQVTKVGKHGALYSIPEGAGYTCIGRGNHPRCRQNLVPWNWQSGLAKMKAMARPKHKKPVPATTLEKCWGWMPRYENTTTSRYASDTDGRVAPNEIAEAA